MHTIQITQDFKELQSVETLAKEAFPPEEYLSPADLIQMAESGQVEFMAIYDQDTFVGFIVVCVFECLCYLFFLAICPELRAQGYGGKILRLLESQYPGKQQVVDFEREDSFAPNNNQRTKRKAFYMRNGYRETNKFISYRGVDYEIVCKCTDFNFEVFKRMMNTFQIEGFDPQYTEE